MRAQLAAAQEADNKPAIVEICQRLVLASPKDQKSWTTLIDTLLAMEDTDRAATAVEACSRANPHAALLEDFRGEIALAKKDFAGAEQHWRAYLATKPAKIDIASTWEKLGDLFVEQQRWPEVLDARTKELGAQNTAANHVARATALLRMHQWDAAFAEMRKANAMDATDAQVKEWLPQFERLQPYVGHLKKIDAQIAKTPTDAEALLERARIFSLAWRPVLAISDAQAAFAAQPAAALARVQLGESFLANQQPDEAAKLQITKQLTLDHGHIADAIWDALRLVDRQVATSGGAPGPQIERARILRELRQYTLALADAKLGEAANDAELAAQAQSEISLDLDQLDQTQEALARAIRATELDSKDATLWYQRGLLEAKRADFAAAIKSQTRSLALRDSYLARFERENCERRIGDIARADDDLQKLRGAKP